MQQCHHRLIHLNFSVSLGRESGDGVGGGAEFSRAFVFTWLSEASAQRQKLVSVSAVFAKGLSVRFFSKNVKVLMTGRTE